MARDEMAAVGAASLIRSDLPWLAGGRPVPQDVQDAARAAALSTS